MKIYNFSQRSPEWYNIRKLKGTASKATEIITRGKGLDTLAKTLLYQYFSNNIEESYSNEHTERGNELESVAKSVYELENSIYVKDVGFIEYNEYIGCSPDGLIGENGLLEIKCPSDRVYFDYLLGETIDNKYMNQIQMQLLITGREWCDLFFYNPNFKINSITHRIFPCKKYFENLIDGFERLEELIKKYKSEYESRTNIT